MALILLRKGVWVDPAVVESVAAFGPGEDFGKAHGPRVQLQSRETSITWHFATYDEAVAVADEIAGRINTP